MQMQCTGFLKNCCRSAALKPHEWCVVFRRRAKLTQEQVAEQVEYCRFTVRKMELGLANCRSLVEYWQNHASQQ